MDTVTGSFDYDDLLVDGWPIHRDEVTVADGETLLRGTVVGKITIGGEVVACDHTAVDGSQVPYGVMVYPVTTSGATAPGLIYDFGLFNANELSFGGTSTVADLKDAMKSANLYVNDVTQL